MADLPILDELRADIGAAARRHQGRRRRVARPALALAGLAIAAAVALVVALGPQGGGGPPADHSGSAPGSVVHVVTEDVSVGGDGRVVQRFETWITPDGCRGRMRVERPPGTLFGELVQTPTVDENYLVAERRVTRSPHTRHTAYEIDDPVATFRRLHQAGALRRVATERRDGRTLTRYERQNGDLVATYVADMRDQMLVEYRLSGGGQDPIHVQRVLRYERVSDRSLLDPRRRDGVRVSRRAGQTGAGASREALRPWCRGR